ncbi:MAG: Holliday junction resolvase RuvX, partial [Candidatus Latescibacterota bacterium]
RTSGDLFVYIERLVDRYAVEEIVVGHPISLSGIEGPSAERARVFADELREHIGVPVALWDERLSSEEAKNVLKGQRADKKSVDRLAAVIILQSYLDHRGGNR